MATITRSPGMNTPNGLCPRHCAEEGSFIGISGYRRAEHRDLPYLEQLYLPEANRLGRLPLLYRCNVNRPPLRPLLGISSLRKIRSETSCLSVVQYNEEDDVVSGICLCNYPNVPSVPPDDWLTWLKTTHRFPKRILAATERNTMFVHWLVWDENYSDHFLKDLLAALFDITTYCQHVILVIPPRVAPADVFEREMTRIPAEGVQDIEAAQSLYLSDRSQFRQKLKIRRIVEEDNDDVIPIIDGETTRLRELYGEYYISEMIRYPDGCRQLIIGEDIDGSAAGAMCLNSTIDIDLLNENFELTAYHGLRKPHENDEEPSDVAKSTSELLQFVFSQMSCEHTARSSGRSSNDNSFHERQATEATDDKRCSEETGWCIFVTRLNDQNESGEDPPANARLGTIVSSNVPTKREVSFQQDVEVDNDDNPTLRDVRTNVPDSTESIDPMASAQSPESEELCKSRSDQIARPDVPSTDVGDLPSILNDVDVQFHSKMQASILAEAMLELSRKRNAPLLAVQVDETVQSRLIHDLLPPPTYHGEKNAFILEIFAMRDGMRPHWSFDFLEAAFDSFPDLDYCVVLLPSTRPPQKYLQHFMNERHANISCEQRVPFRCNKDFPMILYVLHRAVLFGEIKCRRAEVRDRNTVQGLLAAMPTKHETLADFDLAMDPLQLDLDCFVFECNDTMLGLAILRLLFYIKAQSIPKLSYNVSIYSGAELENSTTRIIVANFRFHSTHHFVLSHIHKHSVEKQVDFVRSRYHVEDYVSMQSIHQDDYGRLLHFVLTPIFFAYHRFFFREIARLSGLTVIFYRLQHEDESALTRKRPLASCLSDMIPVNPRKQAGYRFPVISEKINMTEVGTKDDDMFSLFMTSPRLAMMPRVMIDLRIVIVGASNCGVALAEYLALRSMCRYTNLTLISPHGLPFDKERSPVETSLLPFRGTFCPEYRRCVAVRTWVNIVYGTMTAINRYPCSVTQAEIFLCADILKEQTAPLALIIFYSDFLLRYMHNRVLSRTRKEKYVTVMNQGNLAYDYLVLTCGLQYQRPTLQGETKARKRGRAYIAMPLEDYSAILPNDVIQILGAILLYGRNIDCYCALRGLIEFGVNPRWITLIEPSLNSDETDDDVFYCDREVRPGRHKCPEDIRKVDEAVTNAVLQNGVRVLSGWCMIDWSLTRRIDGQIAIENITIEKKGETRTLLCDILLNFHEKTINLNAFFAFCRAGLVFNGSLIIDLECRTNDPFIFAAGTMTKYSRRFRAESSQHIYFSSIEVGQRVSEIDSCAFLAEILQREINVQRNDEEISQLWEKQKARPTVPVFRAPVVIACILPGDYHYLHVRKPGKETLAINRKPSVILLNYIFKFIYYSNYLITQNMKYKFGDSITPARNLLSFLDIQGEVFITGSCTSKIGYFRIRLNPYDSVDTVTCLRRKTFEVQDMIALYGKHEIMLNELKFRFKNSSVSDLYAYFREPWATAIFHDRFECLRAENRVVLLSRTHAHTDSMVDDCVSALIKSKWQEISKQDRRYIESRYAGSIYYRKLENNLVSFLEFYESDLPMYCTPCKQRRMYMDVEDSPLYFEQ
ncbi:cilia- and flagella-associated protein 61 [Harpegnathos saltator]|uniref:cilia- and flagella-associated protein 61 n=1 Tax=Harpegnathos saltator TaxID=610380 RepID=UPI000DBEDB63|nr:cilia- and flagella-associated protein 61 [Harpegnathos saltator]